MNTANFFKRNNFENIWLFITGKCNLKCDYCFFSSRQGKQDLSFAQVRRLTSLLLPGREYCFVISGGEPLLRWDFTRKTVIYLRRRYPQSAISLQTNMLFFSAEKARFLKRHDVIVEPGIDGGFLVNHKHRRGINRQRYKKCLDNLDTLVKYGIRMNPTMTVHPQEAGKTGGNFRKLVSRGIKDIEIHPAFMARWDYISSKTFAVQYKTLVDNELDGGKNLISKEYSVPMKRTLDLVIQPDGLVLPNWTFLAFPPAARSNFILFRVSEKGIDVFRRNLLPYLKKLQHFFRIPRSYREFSNFNAYQIIEDTATKTGKKNFSVYRKLCKRIQAIDIRYLTKRKIR